VFEKTGGVSSVTPENKPIKKCRINRKAGLNTLN
jgi:hypothetical protein